MGVQCGPLHARIGLDSGLRRSDEDGYHIIAEDRALCIWRDSTTLSSRRRPGIQAKTRSAMRASAWTPADKSRERHHRGHAPRIRLGFYLAIKSSALYLADISQRL